VQQVPHFWAKTAILSGKKLAVVIPTQTAGALATSGLHLDHLIKESEPAHIAKNDENDARVAR